MKAIIVSDAELRSLLDQLALEKFRSADSTPVPENSDLGRIHRRFHFVVSRWIQEVGGDPVGR